MRTFILISLAIMVLAGCGGSASSSGSSGSTLNDGSTCNDWLSLHGAAGTDAKNAYMRSKGVEVGAGSPGEALSAWVDQLCGKDGAVTSFTALSTLGEVFPNAKGRFDAGQTYPPSTPTP